jgi:hypothetical protein
MAAARRKLMGGFARRKSRVLEMPGPRLGKLAAKERAGTPRGVPARPSAAPTCQCVCPWPWPAASGSSFSGLSVTSASVVSSMPAIEAAFCTADLVTLTGSMTP